MILLRLVIAAAPLCLPLVLLILASGKAENAMFLLFPLFGGVPAVLGALLAFAPLALWSVLGALWGALWRCSAWLLSWAATHVLARAAHG